MHPSKRRIARRAAGLAAAATLGLAANASAQTHGWALDRFDPSPAGDTFFAADRPWYNGSDRVALRFGILADYAHDPLVDRNGGQGTGISDRIVEHMLVLHAQVGVSFLDRVNVHLSLPFSLVQDGTPSGGLAAMSSPAAGDPRLGVRVRLWNHADTDRVSLHVGGEFYFNAALFGLGPAAFTTDDGFRGRLYATAAGRIGPVAYSASLGGHIRPVTNGTATEVGPDLFVTAAAAWVGMQDRLTVGLEFYGSTVIDHAFGWGYTNGELLAGAHYLFADKVLVGLGVGPGLSQGVGTPDVRAVAQVAWAPEHRAPVARPDADHDGVPDDDDMCAAVPSGNRPDPARPGCPFGDSDEDGVLDPDDLCPDDAAGDHPDPARRGCPVADRDHDGVLDAADQCPDEAQGATPDPARAGCPDGDDDHDGVLNAADQCRTEPAGPTPDPQRPGCPVPDRDHDTVLDADDRCPDQPGVPDADPARNGCPSEAHISNCQLNVARPVFFASNSDVILARSNGILTAVSRAMHRASNIRRVAVEGHTDDAGDDARNQTLSERRAASVVRWLSLHDVTIDRLEAHGFGESRPLRPVAGLTGRALVEARGINRRVEFRILDGGPTCTETHAPGGAR